MHAAPKLTKPTFNKFTPPPPPQKGLFWGGKFWNSFINFWVWDTKNILERLWGKADVLGYLSANSFHFRLFYDIGKFKKSRIFSIFGHIWQLLFSKYDFGPNWS
jgi:hypothetical protein